MRALKAKVALISDCKEDRLQAANQHANFYQVKSRLILEEAVNPSIAKA